MFRNLATRPAVLSMSLFAVLGLAVIMSLPVFGQGGAHPGRIPLPVDWSFKHVVYTRNFTPGQAATMQQDPRLYNSWLLQGHVQAGSSVNQGGGNGKGGGKNSSIARDWSFPLGSAGVAQDMFPAKYNFDVKTSLSLSNCTSDFVVYGLNVAGRNTGTASTGTVNIKNGFSTSNDGTTVTIGSKTYRFKTTLAAANDVKIGVDQPTTAANLAHAINDDSGEGSLYGTGTTQNSDVSATSSGSGNTGDTSLTARTSGEAGTLLPFPRQRQATKPVFRAPL